VLTAQRRKGLVKDLDKKTKNLISSSKQRRRESVRKVKREENGKERPNASREIR